MHLQLIDGEDSLQSACPLQKDILGLLQITLHEVGVLLEQGGLHQLVQAPEGAVKVLEPLVVRGQDLPCRPPLKRGCPGPAFPSEQQ